MALEHLYTASIETGPVPATVNIYADDNTSPWGAAAVAAATGTPAELDLAPGNSIRYGKVEPDFGPAILASFAELKFFDPDGLLAERFARLADEEAYLITVEAPAHETESGVLVPAFVWYARPMKAKGIRPLARTVFPDGAVTLRAYDRLGLLARLFAEPATGFTNLNHYISRELQRVNPHLPTVVAHDVWPANAAEPPRDSIGLRFGEEPAGSGSGDYGKLAEQLERGLLAPGLVLFQHTTSGVADPRTAGPALWCVHRSYLGVALDEGVSELYAAGRGVARRLGSYAVAADELALAEEDVRGTRNDVAEEVSALSAVRFEAGEQANQVRQPFGGTLGDGETDTQALVAVSAEAGVRVRLSATFLGYLYEMSDANTYYHPGSLRLELWPFDGSTPYYLQPDGQWSQTLASALGPLESGSVPFPPTRAEAVEVASVKDFPALGQLVLVAIGESYENPNYDGVTFLSGNADLSNVALVFEDDAGNPITSYVVTYAGAPAGGEVVELETSPAWEVDLDGTAGMTWGNPEGWVSRVYLGPKGAPVELRAFDEYRAFDLLQQRRRDLAAPSCRVWGLHGPGRRLVFPASLLATDAPVPCRVGGGLVIDLDATATEGGWVEALPPNE